MKTKGKNPGGWTERDRKNLAARLIKRLENIKDQVQDVVDPYEDERGFRVIERHIDNAISQLVRRHTRWETNPDKHFMTLRSESVRLSASDLRTLIREAYHQTLSTVEPKLYPFDDPDQEEAFRDWIEDVNAQGLNSYDEQDARSAFKLGWSPEEYAERELAEDEYYR
jgi:hypothetical protein